MNGTWKTIAMFLAGLVVGLTAQWVAFVVNAPSREELESKTAAIESRMNRERMEVLVELRDLNDSIQDLARTYQAKR